MSGVTRVDKLLARLKNNPIAASVIVIGTIVIALAAFTDATHKILDFFPSRNPLLACGAAQWSTKVIQNPYSQDDRFRYIFHLTALGNQLKGSLRQTSSEGRYDISNPIAEGTTNGQQVHFVVHEVWDNGRDQKILVTRSFDGSVVRNEIHFIETNNQGQEPREFVASCLGDAGPTKR